MRWAEHIIAMEKQDIYKIFWLENLKRRGHSEDLDVDGKIILDRILGKTGGKV
jgi:hypothetical protein